jgi:AcrR family transcriptional regulator
MTKTIPNKRKYDSSRRKAQALETHTLILEAAKGLFIERGYAGTSIEAIAQKTGVAAETIYSIFGNKKMILSQLAGILVTGNDENPIPPLVRDQLREVENEKNQNRQIQMFAQRIQMVMSQIAPFLEVMKSAAKTEPEINKMLKKYLDVRFQGMGYFIDCVMANGPLGKNINKLDAVETAWTLTSAEVYNLLTTERDWSAEEYETWLSKTMIRLLLP